MDDHLENEPVALADVLRQLDVGELEDLLDAVLVELACRNGFIEFTDPANWN